MGRSEKYIAKNDGDVMSRRTEAYHDIQTHNFDVSTHRQEQIEREVSAMMVRAGIPLLRKIYYVEFARQLAALVSRLRGDVLMDEVTGLENLWEGRGLDPTFCETLKTFYVPGWSPPGPVINWLYKITLTLSGNGSATTLTDFPALVKLDVTNFDFTHAQSAGQDLRFMATDIQPDAGTPLSHEIEYWDAGSQLAYVWVKVPTITGGSTTDKIYMYFDNAAAPDGQHKTDVWSNGYGFVMHGFDDPDSSHITDATGNGNTGTKTGAGDPLQSGPNTELVDYQPPGYYQHYNATSSKVTIPHSTTYDTTGDMSIELYFSYTMAGALRIVCGKWPGAHHNEYAILMYGPGGDQRRLLWYIATNGDGGASFLKSTTLINDVQDYHIVCNVTGNLMKIYINGVAEVATQTFTGTRAVFNYPFTLGQLYEAGYGYLNGGLDEVRFSKDARTDGWILDSFRSVVYGLLTFGAEEPG
jgi:hypothetical protein